MYSGFLFGGFQIIFYIVFFIVIAGFITILIRGLVQWNKNNHSPRLTVEATVVSKQTDVTRHHHNTGTAGHGMHTTSSTSYYVTFQVQSGDRIELAVSRHDYGMLAEGDRGMLSFQGTRYQGFQRH